MILTTALFLYFLFEFSRGFEERIKKKNSNNLGSFYTCWIRIECDSGPHEIKLISCWLFAGKGREEKQVNPLTPFMEGVVEGQLGRDISEKEALCPSLIAF